MTCPWCGNPVRVGEPMCGRCGKPVVGPPPPPSQVISQVPGFAVTPPAPVVRAVAEATDYPAEATQLAPRTESPWTLALIDGTRYAISGALIVGRAPVVLDRWPHGLLVAADHPGVSKTHVVFEYSDGRLFVNDLGSTNGIVVHRTGELPLDLEPHQRVEVTAPTVVELGSYAVHIGRGQ